MATRFAHRDVTLAGTSMHYLDAGAGQPVVFLHGNPTSSYLWRSVLADIELGLRRAVAVDLIGMGRSGRPPIGYHLADHIAYVEAFVATLDLNDIVFVAHDWGVAIALAYLHRHPARVAAVTFMEGHLWPLADWSEFDAGGRELFRSLRTPGVGERMVQQDRFFPDVVLSSAIRPPLTEADLQEYSQVYPTPGSRLPLLQWAREIPVGGDPARNATLMAASWADFTESSVPKLLIHGGSGVVLTVDKVAQCRSRLSRLTVVDAGDAGHFLPEERPHQIAAALSRWLADLTA
jgi:haloalkane dehalogenase